MNCRIVLNDAYKTVTHDQDKVLAPAATVQNFKDRLKRVDLDILAGIQRIDNGRLDIPVYVSRCGKDAQAVIGNRKQMGKGGTPEQAEASAVMELAERFSLFSYLQTPAHFIKARQCDLVEPVIPFEMIIRSVSDDTDHYDLLKTLFSTLPLDWVKACNLTRDEEYLIPFNWFYTINEYNGSSAGNCREEALLQGLCEVVERDVSARVCGDRLEVPGIATQGITDPVVLEMLAKYDRAGIKLFLSDFTLDMGIPTVSVLAYDPSTFPERSEIVWTAGTTPDPQKALSRALTETAQLGGDFNTGANYVASGLPKFGAITDAAMITHPQKTVTLDDLPNLAHANIKVEITHCIDALKRKGLEVIVVDIAHPQLEVPAFYTIIPGARFRERAQQSSVGLFAAKILTQTVDPLTAVNELKRMQRQLTDRYYLDFYLGTCLLELAEPAAALRHFERAQTLNPSEEDRVSIYAYMGLCLKDTGAYRQAIEVLSQGIALDPDRTDIYNLMGVCHFKLGEHAKAIDCFQHVLRLNPSSAIDYANIGVNFRALGETTKAVEYLVKALMIDPTIEFAQKHLAELRS